MTIESEPRARPKTDARASKDYGAEHVDQLPYGSDEKAERYATERFHGATGLNWYDLRPDAAARDALLPDATRSSPGRSRISSPGRADGRADLRARRRHRQEPAAKLVKYDRWGHDVSEVIIPESALGDEARSDRARLLRPARSATRRRRPASRRCRWRSRRATCSTRPRSACHARWVRTRGWCEPGRAVRAGRHPAVGALEARVRRVDRRDRAVLHRAHRRLRPRRARDDGDPGRRRLAAERLQVVRLEPRRRGVRRAGEAGRRARQHPRHRAVPRADASGATARATASTSASSRRSSARRPSPRARSSSPTPRRSCSRATPEAGGGERRRSERRPERRAADGDDERRPARRRDDGPRLRAARARGVALLREGAHAPGRRG